MLTLLLGALLLLPALAFAAEPIRPIANMFDPVSRPAELIHSSAVVVSLICAGIFLVVTFMLIYVVVKFPSKGKEDEGKEPPQIYGSKQIELAWTIIPILITIVLILVTTRTIGEVQDAKLPDDALRVRVIGHQWWWEIHYLVPDGKDEKGETKWKTDFVTANELHIPVSSRDQRRPTELFLEAADVIHSYWVPQLNGKTDLIPNRQNKMWLEPYQVGTYLGNCAEYCGTQHANMLIRVMVQTPEDFETWRQNQRAAAVQPAPGTPEAEGRRIFYAYSCVNCHHIDGARLPKDPLFGPDLSHFGIRTTLGSGVAANDVENLKSWLHDPHILKPGVLMPNMQLTPTEVDQLTAYLLSLK